MHLVLGYVEALAWPAVAVFAMVRFSDALKGLFSERKAKSVSTPFVSVELEASEQRASRSPLALPEAAPANAATGILEAWGAELADVPRAATAAELKGGVQLLQTLNEIFEFQLDYLRLLQKSQGRLTVGATAEWFRSRSPGGPDTPIETLIGYLLLKKLIERDEPDAYVLTARGALLVEFERSFFYAQKAW